MKLTVRVIAALALIGFIAGCAELGIQPSSEQPTYPASIPYSD